MSPPPWIHTRTGRDCWGWVEYTFVLWFMQSQFLGQTFRNLTNLQYSQDEFPWTTKPHLWLGGVDIEVEAVLRTNHVAGVVAKVVLIFNLEIAWLISSILFGFQKPVEYIGLLSIPPVGKHCQVLCSLEHPPKRSAWLGHPCIALVGYRNSNKKDSNNKKKTKKWKEIKI